MPAESIARRVNNFFDIVGISGLICPPWNALDDFVDVIGPPLVVGLAVLLEYGALSSQGPNLDVWEAHLAAVVQCRATLRRIDLRVPIDCHLRGDLAEELLRLALFVINVRLHSDRLGQGWYSRVFIGTVLHHLCESVGLFGDIRFRVSHFVASSHFRFQDWVGLGPLHALIYLLCGVRQV